MAKHRFYALTGAEKTRIAKLSIAAAVAIILVFACIMWTIEGSLWATIPGVVFACIGCVCLEEVDKVETKAKERESQK
jgi:archaellum biogenesis protein FlaJ (TadC family)